MDEPKDTVRAPSRMPLALGLSMVGVGVAALAFVYWPSADKEKQPPRASDEPMAARVTQSAPKTQANEATRSVAPPTASAPAAPASGKPAFWDEPGPEFIRVAYDFMTTDERRMRGEKTMEIYKYGQEHPTDARPQLLLAFEDVKRGWWNHAVTHYELAHGADPRALDEPRVARDLAVVVGQEKHREKAWALMQRLFGADALPLMQKELERLQGFDDKGSRFRRKSIETAIAAVK